MRKIIDVIDDEPDILELVSIHLEREGFKVNIFTDGESFLESLKNNIPDLIVLDLMLPDIDGFDICKRLKRDNNYELIPIIMLTAKGQEMDKIIGLELGADDYITKPFSPRELVARIKAVLRRSSEKVEKDIISVGDKIIIYTNEYKVTVDGEFIDLTSTEFKLLKMLAERKAWVFTREQILNYLWGEEKAVLDRTVDVHIAHLRSKLGEYGRIIKNVRGVGYKLEE